MRILSIETSCDETGIALLEIQGSLDKPDIKVLANALYSQAKLHEKYGGVYPNLAKREHQKNLPILLDQILLQAKSYKLQATDIDFIAVTSGPGLEPALWAGITFAEDFGKKWGKPVVPVDHMEGHIFSVLFREQEEISNYSNYSKKLEFPALALLVSGGHTELVHIETYGKYKILGRTRDDAVGEAFDKVARMLGLPYPGGPEISRLAEISRERGQDTINFPRPMLHSDDLDFSFSGLKTAVLYYIKSSQNTDTECLGNEGFKEDVARAFEDAAIEALVGKTRQAILNTDVRSLIVAGGVSVNKHLMTEAKKLKESYSHLEIYTPEKELTTDNAVMIGISAYVNVSLNPKLLENQKEIKATGNLEIGS